MEQGLAGALPAEKRSPSTDDLVVIVWLLLSDCYIVFLSRVFRFGFERWRLQRR